MVRGNGTTELIAVDAHHVGAFDARVALESLHTALLQKARVDPVQAADLLVLVGDQCRPVEGSVRLRTEAPGERREEERPGLSIPQEYWGHRRR